MGARCGTKVLNLSFFWFFGVILVTVKVGLKVKEI